MSAAAFKFFLVLNFLISTSAFAAEIKPGDPAPLFKVKTHDGTDFELAKRQGTWTVLFFYPKAGTPGCTKQVCAFRDNIKKIHDLGAEVYGISGDSVEDQAAFHKSHQLKYALLADPDVTVAKLYGSKMPVLKMSKRWTFLIDPTLIVRFVDRDVDPVLDPEKVVAKLKELKR